MNSKKRIMMVTVDHLVNAALTKQLKDIFGSEVEIESAFLKESDIIDTKNVDIVVCSSKAVEKEVKSKMTYEVPLVSVKRTIELKHISELISLNTGEEVLLVSNYPSTANETIELLKEMGIDHIKFIPYYPGCKEPIRDIAVTPGGKHIVPKGVKRIIDIGLKIIDISSIIEIFLKLNLPTEELPILSAEYSKEMIRFNKYLSDSNKMLKAMFEVTNDGIAALDVSGNIFFCNNKFAELIGYKNEQLISMNITELINDNNIVDIMMDQQQRNNEIVNVNNKELMLNKTLLYQGNYLKGHVISIQEIVHIQNLEKEVRKRLISKGFIAKYDFNDLIGKSPELQSKIKISKKIAQSDLTVLIQGEDGTGKEIFANAIHNASKRKNEPFVAVNMASLSENLVESELFGYEEGAFTGASKGGKAGFFEQADRGTIFIDEIGDASPKIQMSLLRVLQEKNIIRVGGTRVIPIDVRVIAATNKDLYELVKEGKFRKDLYYRLKVLHFRVPTLKERIEDVPLLADYFFRKLNSNKRLSDEVIEIFKNYSWPGNVRELENLIYYLDSIVESKVVTLNDLPEDLLTQLTKDRVEKELISEEAFTGIVSTDKMREYVEILKVLEKANILNIKIGRNKISDMLKMRGVYLSSEQVRTKLKDLDKIGLVDVGTTKQGTTITERGRLFLKKYDENN
mgnify:FL=1